MQLPCDGDPPNTSSSASAGGRTGVLGEFSVFVGNLDPETALAEMEELLYELFLQVRIRSVPFPDYRSCPKLVSFSDPSPAPSFPLSFITEDGKKIWCVYSEQHSLSQFGQSVLHKEMLCRTQASFLMVLNELVNALAEKFLKDI